jgi:hypothetical protein
MRFHAVILCLFCTHVFAQAVFEDDFENGLLNWEPLSASHANVIREGNAGNHVLQLVPNPSQFSHVILKKPVPGQYARLEGRVLFPTDGNGYLGLIYNHLVGEERTDFGVLYIKSNGSYIRVSPHYDGNPSWRLYEEMNVPLEGDRKIQSNTWYDFRLDVHQREATLFFDDLSSPLVTFSEAPNDTGSFGLEARPGRGDPVWVDDIRITTLEPTALPKKPLASSSNLQDWQYQSAITDPMDGSRDSPKLNEQSWLKLSPDPRGAIITGKLTQYNTGELSVVYLRSRFEAPAGVETSWLAISSANRIDVWSNGYYRGSVAPENYIWADHIDNPGHYGSRLSLRAKAGSNELILRVFGRTFAAGGFYADVIYPSMEGNP